MTKRLGGAALAASLAALAPAVAHASAVTGTQLHQLAARAAAGDTLALAELRGVSAVDGRPTQLAGLLDARTARQLQSRLATLSAGGTSAGSAGQAPGEARRTAAALLDARRFGTKPVPDPIGTVLDKLARAVGRLATRAPGGPAIFWGVVAVLVLALTGLGVRRTMRRLDPMTRTRAGADAANAETPDSLEREAQAAETRGAFGDAVRLRFRAGLLLLSARKTIDYRPSLLTTDVARRLHSPQFDALAATFERIAYGGAPGAEADAAAAREGWKAVLTREPRG
jgi:hypothetical protein